MPIANDLRKTLTDPTPLYFAAGVLDKLREEVPQQLAAVRETDPKEVQARLARQAKETQAKVSETLGGIDTDIKKLREQAQHLALQGVGVAAEYAVKARETYDELAVRGRVAVRNWRGEDGGAPEVTVEREPVKVAEPPAEEADEPVAPAARSASAGGDGSAEQSTVAGSGAAESGPAESTARSSSAKGTAKSGTAKSGGSAGARANGTGAKSGTRARKTSPRKTATEGGTASGGETTEV